MQSKLVDQIKIATSNKQGNSKRVLFEYEIGKIVLLGKPGVMRNLSIPRQGLYKILTVHNNETLTIQVRPNAIDQVNITQLTLYFEQ